MAQHTCPRFPAASNIAGCADDPRDIPLRRQKTCHFPAVSPRLRRRSRRPASSISTPGAACSGSNSRAAPRESWSPARPARPPRCDDAEYDTLIAIGGGNRCWPDPGPGRHRADEYRQDHRPDPPRRGGGSRFRRWWSPRPTCARPRPAWSPTTAPSPTRAGCRWCCTTSPAAPVATCCRKPWPNWFRIHGIVGIKEARAEPERMAALLALAQRRLRGAEWRRSDRLPGDAGRRRWPGLGRFQCLAARLPQALRPGPGQQRAAAEAQDAALQPFYTFFGIESNPIPVKALLQRMGYGAGLRLPLLPLSAAHAAEADRLHAAASALEQQSGRETVAA